MRVDTASRLILHWLLECMRLNEAGLRSGSDPEYLHDYRVAIRKTRSALAQFKGTCGKRAARNFKSEFAWLGQVTGPARDLDVYVQTFSDYRKHLPAPSQQAIGPFQEYLVQCRAREYTQMLAQLDSDRYRGLLADWSAYLDTNNSKSQSSLAEIPVQAVASRYIRKAYKRVLRHGRSITPDSTGASLHKLRKDCKQLRYLMEFFRSLYPAADIRQLIAFLTLLQDNLGDLQDRTVQLGALDYYTLLMSSELTVTAETLHAIDGIAAILRDQRDRFRAGFADRFREFDMSAHRKQFRKLFSS
ncbi:MAG: CHAD domain-containing protein [Thiohalobacterales bacterium]